MIGTVLSLFVLLGLAVFHSDKAAACSCVPYSPSIALGNAEVIIDGVVIQRDPIAGDFEDPTPKTARMRVHTTWKGDLAPIVTLHFDESSASCGRAPPIGAMIRIAPFRVASSTDVGFGSCMELPMDDPELNRLLAEYKQRTEEVRNDTQTAGREGQQRFAKYLRGNGELYRAMTMYQSLKAADPSDIDALLGEAVLQVRVDYVDGEKTAEALLAEARQAGRGVSGAPGKIARAEAEAFGRFDPAWKDWSHIEVGYGCKAKWQNFDGATFDGSRLSYCRFVGSSLKGASMKGADLRDSDLSGADLAGAVFDCDTGFPYRFDPIEAGMLRVDGANCPASSQN